MECSWNHEYFGSLAKLTWASLTLQETGSIHDSMNSPKLNSFLKFTCIFLFASPYILVLALTKIITFLSNLHLIVINQGFLGCSQGPKFSRIPNLIRVTFFPILKKNPNLNFFFDFVDFHSITTHTSYTTICASYFSFNFLMC